MDDVLGGHYCQSEEDTLVGGVLEGHCSRGESYPTKLQCMTPTVANAIFQSH